MDHLLDFPVGAYKYRPLKRNDRGQDVAALQLNLGIDPHGAFGPITFSSVRNYQSANGLKVDGIAGIRTQESMALVAATVPQSTQRTPRGLLRGIIEGESGWLVAQVTAPHADGSRDVGWVQRNLSSARLKDVLAVQEAFTGRIAITYLAKQLRARKDANDGRPGVRTDEESWRYAVLAHNWPAAAEQFVNGTIAAWTYSAVDSNGATKQYRMSDPADWVINIGVENVRTGYDWAKFYIDGKVSHVRVWPE